MVMLKTRNKNKGTKFILFSIEGESILSYSFSCGEIFLGNKSNIFIDNIISVDYSKEYNKIIVLAGECLEEYKLSIFELNGNEVTNITHPRDYYFFSTKCVGNDILVVCQGIRDKMKDKYGRNDWNFRVDLNNYYVEKISITQ